MESDDSPEIPERGKTPDIPGFPSGAHAFTHTHTETYTTHTHTHTHTTVVAREIQDTFSL